MRHLRYATTLVHAFAFVGLLHLLLRTVGFERARRWLLRPWKNGCRALTPDSATVQDIERAVVTACTWQVLRTQCLYRALCTYHLLQSARGEPQFVLAVRVRPFASHAWTQLSNTVIADRTATERYELFTHRLFTYPEGK